MLRPNQVARTCKPSKIPAAFSIYQPRADTSDAPGLPGLASVTIPRLAAIAIACLVFVDMKFGGSQIAGALRDRAKSVGYSLNNELQGVTYGIGRLH
jgi:hypothetical protein